MTRGPKPLPRAERFAARVLKTDDCWLWTGTVHNQRGGYGAFYDDAPHGRQKLRRAHRVAYELAHGVDLSNASHIAVRHSCDNPPCVRPHHLVLGTQANNLQDMRDRGRESLPPVERGTQRYNAKLTEEIVQQARSEHAAGASFSALARKYGVTRPCITQAIKGQGWAHVGPPSSTIVVESTSSKDSNQPGLGRP